MDYIDRYHAIDKALKAYQKEQNSLLDKFTGISMHTPAGSTNSLMSGFVSQYQKDILGINNGLSKLMASSRNSFVNRPLTASHDLSKIFGHVNLGVSLESIRLSSGWNKLFEPYRALPDMDKIAGTFLQSHVTEMARFTNLSEAMLKINTMESITKAFNIEKSLRTSVMGTTKSFLKSYPEMIQIYEKDASKLFSLNPTIIKSTSIEYFTGSNVIYEISPRKSVQAIEPEILDTITEISSETNSKIDVLLNSVNPRLVKLWRGAIQSLDSTNPDKIRHFITSLRELTTQILHHLAPNKDFIIWNKEPKYIDKGNPTRAGRVYYICRNIYEGKFKKFVDSDVKASLVLIDFFQSGTHSVDISFNDAQLNAIKLKTETLICYLIEISQNNFTS